MKVQVVVRMKMAKLALRVMPCILLFVGVTKTESSDERTRAAIVHPLANANFKTSGDPSCLSTAVEVGDPSTGPGDDFAEGDEGLRSALALSHGRGADHGGERRVQGGNDQYAGGDSGAWWIHTDPE